MKIISYNINGIRASSKLGLIDFILNSDFDVWCLQEVRASEDIARQILAGENQINLFDNAGGILDKFYVSYNCGKVAGYAGTLVLSRFKFDKVLFDMQPFWMDDEGRTTTVIINKLAIVNTYIPNGNSRLEFKLKYLDALTKYLNMLKKDYYVVCVGDFNIAHNEIDLTNPKECKNKSVFLPVERAAFDKILDVGYLDSFRFLYPDKIEYSWRSYRSLYDMQYNSWKYRIDYCLISNNLKPHLKQADILDVNYSDHLPVCVEIE